MSVPASDPAPAVPCQTRIYYSTLPTDLVTWAQAAAELAGGPHPMSERDLRRRYKADERRRTWRLRGQRAEYVSLAAVFEFHRDLHRGWMTARH